MDAWAVAAGLLAVAASVTDVTRRRIPNALTLPAAVAAATYWSVAGGWSGLAWSAGGWAVGLLLFLPLFALRGMGGGDVKLLAAVGAWVGPSLVVWVALAAAIAGGVLGVSVALARGYLRQAVTNVGSMVLFWRVAGLQPHPAMTLDSPTAVRLPYALPIAVGLLVTLWLR